MKPVLFVPGGGKPEKMGFDGHYFIMGTCGCCGVVMPKWSGDLWKDRCFDCAPESYKDPDDREVEA
ncbi:MAG TPA: hypothetical protein VJ873_10275 [bacterium]|nr:hypothetical protein [bacterium]